MPKAENRKRRNERTFVPLAVGIADSSILPIWQSNFPRSPLESPLVILEIRKMGRFLI